MQSRAQAKYVRIAPRKARIVADLIRGKDIEEALSILRFTPKRGAHVVEKVVRSALANAEHNYDMNKDDLYIHRIFVDEGPTLRRFRPRALGRATPIRKRTSHITAILSEREEE